MQNLANTRNPLNQQVVVFELIAWWTHSWTQGAGALQPGRRQHSPRCRGRRGAGSPSNDGRQIPDHPHRAPGGTSAMRGANARRRILRAP